MTAAAIVKLIIQVLTTKDAVKLIIKGVNVGFSVTSVLKFVSVVSKVRDEVVELLKDGNLSVDEAEAEAAKLLGGEDLKVKIGGEDVLDDKAQDLLVRGLARVFATAAKAKLS